MCAPKLAGKSARANVPKRAKGEQQKWQIEGYFTDTALKSEEIWIFNHNVCARLSWQAKARVQMCARAKGDQVYSRVMMMEHKRVIAPLF